MNNADIMANDFRSVNAWSNDNGSFYQEPQQQYYNDGGRQAMLEQIRTSMPYIFTVVNADTASGNVQLFGANVNLSATNNGNPGTISITANTETWNGAGGANGYVAIIANTMTKPITMAKVRQQCTNTTQLTQALTWADNNPTGAASSVPIIFFQALDQYFANAVEQVCDVTIAGNNTLNYTQLASTTVTWFVWASEVASLSRTLSGKQVSAQFGNPKTLLAPDTLKLQVAPSAQSGGF